MTVNRTDKIGDLQDEVRAIQRDLKLLQHRAEEIQKRGVRLIFREGAAKNEIDFNSIIVNGVVYL
jgi:hypothetical protein